MLELNERGDLAQQSCLDRRRGLIKLDAELQALDPSHYGSIQQQRLRISWSKYPQS